MNPSDNPSSIIRMLELLGQGPKTKKVLAGSLSITERQVERIFLRLEGMFYNIDKNEHNEYFVFGAEQWRKGQFTDAEKEFLIQLLHYAGRSHVLTAGILRKLSRYELPLPLKEPLKEVVKNSNIDNLNAGIKHGVLVWLKLYFSPNNPEKFKDRLVLPVEINHEHHQLIAYEKASRKIKTYKIDRIGRVELTNDSFPLPKSRGERTDLFGFRGKQLELVKLKMTPLAAQLFREEIPGSAAYLQPAGEGFECTIPIMNTQGIGRFVLGLPGEIFVLKGAKLKAYLHEKMKNQRF